jgi:hypothetical protein
VFLVGRGQDSRSLQWKTASYYLYTIYLQRVIFSQRDKTRARLIKRPRRPVLLQLQLQLRSHVRKPVFLVTMGILSPCPIAPASPAIYSFRFVSLPITRHPFMSMKIQAARTCRLRHVSRSQKGAADQPCEPNPGDDVPPEVLIS